MNLKNVIHFIVTIFYTAFEVITGRRALVDDSTYVNRLKKCNKPCEERDEFLFCHKCKCYTPLKARFRRERCPKGYW